MVYAFEGKKYGRWTEMCTARRKRYVEYLEAGLNSTQAAKAVGVSKRTGKVWRNGRTRNSGRNENASVDWYRGDMCAPKKIDSYYLSEDERIDIADGLLHRDSIRKIAEHLGRSPSTISREIRNNSSKDGTYRPHRAQQLSTFKLSRPKQTKIENPVLFAIIDEKLRLHWSPEQISGWLKLKFPDNRTMNVSTETIYQAIYVQSKGQLKKDIVSKLRTGRVRRHKQKQADKRRPRYRDPMVMIAERPASIEDRVIPGHWEGDLIVGAHNKTAIGTLVERTTRFTILLYLPKGHDAVSVQKAIIKKMRDLPALMRNSLTWDQGGELALHKKIAINLDMDVYFCDPHSPWQRGTNENTNGLLRQYFPKSTDLSVYSEEYLDAVAEELNDRPRKTLGFRKPAELFCELINGAA